MCEILMNLVQLNTQNSRFTTMRILRRFRWHDVTYLSMPFVLWLLLFCFRFSVSHFAVLTLGAFCITRRQFSSFPLAAVLSALQQYLPGCWCIFPSYVSCCPQHQTSYSREKTDSYRFGLFLSNLAFCNRRYLSILQPKIHNKGIKRTLIHRYIGRKCLGKSLVITLKSYPQLKASWMHKKKS